MVSTTRPQGSLATTVGTLLGQSDLVKTTQVCVVGLGYVGLPVALALGRTGIKTFGYDVNPERIATLKRGIDYNHESATKEITSSKVQYGGSEKIINRANFIIVAVPTPINEAHQPDLTILKKASELVGRNLKKGSIVVYESTVYPGVTEEICGPILEKISGLRVGIDFKLGYSPERINPGDKEHTLERVVKVVAGSDQESTRKIAALYASICNAGVFVAANIKTAEAAKVIENTQRDLNISLMNELSLIFHRLGIDTHEVLEAAGTKWNFLKFTPGLVGGHCIGVDPYYLVYRAEEVGYHPQVIAAGRRVNDYMSEFVAWQTIEGLIEAGKNIQQSRVLVLGLAFKENISDLRNSRIGDTINKLTKLGIQVEAYDPVVSHEEAKEEFGFKPISRLVGRFDAIIASTPHQPILDLGDKLLDLMPTRPVFVDVKSVFRSFRRVDGLIYKNL